MPNFQFVGWTVNDDKHARTKSEKPGGKQWVKKYKLSSKFVLGLGVKHKDPDGADKIVIDYTKDMIGDIPVKTIELYYLKDTLAKIIVNVSPE